MLFGIVRVPRLFLQPERAHIADDLYRRASANHAHIVFYIFRCSHIALPLRGPGEEVFGFER